jgi:hypothetical protein
MINAFKEYLLLRGSVKSTYVPFYLKWVSACYELLDLDPSSRLTIDQKKQFLAHMTKRYEDWQVKQADTALRRSTDSCCKEASYESGIAPEGIQSRFRESRDYKTGLRAYAETQLCDPAP